MKFFEKDSRHNLMEIQGRKHLITLYKILRNIGCSNRIFIQSNIMTVENQTIC